MTQVRFFENAKESEGRIIFGYNAKTTEYFLTGIGGYRFAFVLDQFIPARGWFPFAAVGSSENFTPNAILVKDKNPRFLLAGKSSIPLVK